MTIQPRPIIRLALLASGAAIAQLAWAFLDMKLLAYVAGLAAPACMLCLSAVWSIRGAADNQLDATDSDSETFARFQLEAQSVRRKAMYLAVQVGFCVVLAAGPAISQQLTATVWQWMVLVSGIAVGNCAYAFLIATSWERQLREFKSAWTLRRMRNAERNSLLTRMTAPASGSNVTHGWAKPEAKLVAKDRL